MYDSLKKAIDNWYNFDGFAKAINREEQVIAKAKHAKLALKVKREIAKLK